MFDGVVAADRGTGAELADVAVAALRSTGFVKASADAVELQAVVTLVHVRRQQARDAARRAAAAREVLDQVGRRRHPALSVDLELVDRCTAQEVSLALSLSPVVARDRLELALELVDRRPVTFEALRAGRIDLVRALRITAAVRQLHPVPVEVDAHVDGEPDEPDEPGTSVDAAALVEAEVLCPGTVPALADRRPARPAGELTPAQLTARLARLVLRADPVGAEHRTALADERRGCSLRVLPDGMALLSVVGRGELLAAAFARIDATARAVQRADRQAHGQGPRGRGPTPGTDAARTLDQTRVDVLLASLLGTSDDLSRANGVTVQLSLVAPVGTILAGGDEPADLDGYGPVPAPLARELAASATWRRWDSDPQTGYVTAVHQRAYRPTTAVAELVRARDRTCRFPTCRRRAQACDLDHVVPWDPGDPDRRTTVDCLATECRLHHLVKHRGGITLSMRPDGTTTWTTPTGQVVTTHPPSWGRPPPGGWHGPVDGADGAAATSGTDRELVPF